MHTKEDKIPDGNEQQRGKMKERRIKGTEKT